MSSNDADGMANSVDPDHTAPVCPGDMPSENLGSLRYGHLCEETVFDGDQSNVQYGIYI